MEKLSSAGICNHDCLATGWRLQSQINAQVRQATFCSGTRTGVRVAESCAKRPTASRWRTRRSLKWCMRKLGKFQFAGDNGVVDNIQDEADEKTPLPDSKIRLREVLTLQSSLSAKAAVGASMLCLQKQGQFSPGFVWEWWAGRRSVCQPRYAVQNQLVCFRAQTTITTDYSLQVRSWV